MPVENIDTNLLKRIETRLRAIVPLIKKSANLIIGTPLVVVPIIVGSFVISVLQVILSPFTVDLFGWWWIGNLYYYSAFTIIASIIYFAVSTIIFNLSALATLDMAKNVMIQKENDIQKSFEIVRGNLVNYAIISLVGQLLIFTYVLIPLGIMVFIVTIADNSDYMTSIKRSIEFIRVNPVDVLILSVAWLLSRFILVQIPSVLFLQIIPDLVIGFTVLDLYLSKTSTNTAI